MTLISRVDRETRSSRDVRSDDSMSIRRSSRHRNFLLNILIDSIVLISIFNALVVSVMSLTSVISFAFVALADLVVFDAVLDVLSTFVLNDLVSNVVFFERRHENSNCLRCVKIEVSCKRRKNVVYRRCMRQKNICVSIRHRCINQLQLIINLSRFSRDFVARLINSLDSFVETSSKI
jgi:hypothetical protein